MDNAKTDVKQVVSKELLGIVAEEKQKVNMVAERAKSSAEMAKIVLAEANHEKTADLPFAEALPALEKADAEVQNRCVEDVNEFKMYKACPEKALDMCVGVNWVIISMNQKSSLWTGSTIRAS